MWEKLKSQFNRLKIEEKSICLITNPDNYKNSNDFLDAVASALNGGVGIILFKKGNIPDSLAVELGQKLKLLCEEFEVTLLVEGRVDIATLINADGVVLSKKHLSIFQAKNYLIENSIIGSYCNSADEIIESINCGSDFVIYETQNNPKTNMQKFNISELIWINENINSPVFVLIDINKNNINQLISIHTKQIALNDNNIKSKKIEDIITQLYLYLPQ